MAGGLAGCDTASHSAAQPVPDAPRAEGNGPGLTLPSQIAGFQRVDLQKSGGNATTAGYVLNDSANLVIATVHVQRATTDGPGPLFESSRTADATASTRALEASVAQVRHYYPGAVLRDVHNVFLVKRGELQAGRAATLRYNDLLEGKRQAIDLDIYTFCCVDGRWDYEYRIRHAADDDAATAVMPFMRALDWSSSQAADAEAGK
jgi:hypothetical protein